MRDLGYLSLQGEDGAGGRVCRSASTPLFRLAPAGPNLGVHVLEAFDHALGLAGAIGHHVTFAMGALLIEPLQLVLALDLAREIVLIERFVGVLRPDMLE